MKNSYMISIVFIVTVFLTISLNAQQGFFIDGWSPKTAQVPDYVDVDMPDTVNVDVTIDFADTVSKVSKYIFSDNANVYSTKMWNKPDLVKHLRDYHPAVLRFPGGDLTNKYFWNLSVGDTLPDVPATVEEWAGKNDQGWTMAPDDFYKLLDSVGAEGSICVNTGYARYGTSDDPVAKAAHLAAEWVRYDSGRTRLWELGNENYGSWSIGYKIDTGLNKDGQPATINGTLYGQHCKVFIDSMRAAAVEVGNDIKIGAVLYSDLTGSTIETQWNSKVLAEIGNDADFFIAHNYFTTYNQNSSASTILNSYTKVGQLYNYLKNGFTSAGLEMKPVAFNEWNIFAINSQQMVSHINGMHAVLLLGNFIKYNFGLSARWDLANGWDNGNDHGLFSQGNGGLEPDVAPFTPRPAFFYITYFQKYFGDVMVNSTSSNPFLHVFASKYESDHAGIVILNRSKDTNFVKLNTENFEQGGRIYWYNFQGEQSDGSFSRKVFINGEGPGQVSGGPDNYNTIPAYSFTAGDSVIVKSPPYSVQYVLLEGQTVVSVSDQLLADNSPQEFKLMQNYPNPFNPSTIISYQLPMSSFVTLKVYDVLGREIKTIVNGSKNTGLYKLKFDGSSFASGVYFYRLNVSNETGNYFETKKMILAK